MTTFSPLRLKKVFNEREISMKRIVKTIKKPSRGCRKGYKSKRTLLSLCPYDVVYVIGRIKV